MLPWTTYDKHLNFNKHTENIADKCNTYINIIRYLTGTTYGCNLRTLKTI